MEKRFYPVFLGIALLVSCSEAPSVFQRKSSSAAEISVKVAPVSKIDDASSDIYVGTVHPDKSTVLTAPYPGTLEELNVRKGQKVSKGEVVAKVVSQSVISSREIAYATLEQARDGYTRVQSVYEAGSVPEVKLVEIKTQLAKAEAAVRSADKALEDCSIKAPYDGTVGEVYVDSGVELAPARPVVKILDVSSVEIHFPVPEKEINSLSVGAKLTVDVPALSLEGVPAKVTVKGISASAVSHCYECVCVPLSRVQGLMPGMVCKVRALSGTGSGNVVVPAKVVRTDEGGRYVWIVDSSDTVRKARITVGGYSGNGVVVTGGLETGDRVIVEGAGKVSSGMKVKTVE
ncbi:MAG: efflux RND transporter periplasmic adaptor subunit [Candidatus Cryptobacteroides sp.]